MPTRYYSNAAVGTSLSAGVDNVTTSIPLQALTGYPTQFPYLITIDKKVLNKGEVCLVTAASGTTLTVIRGYDGTAAVAHDPGAEVSHDHSAIDYREVQERLDVLESDGVLNTFLFGGW